MTILVPTFSRFARGWPEHPDGCPCVDARTGRPCTQEPAVYRELSSALSSHFPDDLHFAAYSAPHVGRRLATDRALEAQPSMVAFVADVDHQVEVERPDGTVVLEKARPTQEWLEAEGRKLHQLFRHRPGGLAYTTRHGYRVVYAIAPHLLRTADDAWQWSEGTYPGWLRELASYGIDADPSCADWTRLYRLPRVMRDGAPELPDVLGDPAAIGRWDAPVLPAPPRPALVAPPDRPAGSASDEARLAAARALAASWPARGRHGACLALSGGLLSLGWSPPEVADFVTGVMAMGPGGSERTERGHAIEYAKQLQQAEHAAMMLARGEPVAGWGALKEFVPAAAVDACQGGLTPPDPLGVMIAAATDPFAGALPGLGSILPGTGSPGIPAALAGTWAGEVCQALLDVRSRLGVAGVAQGVPEPLFEPALVLLNRVLPPVRWLVRGLLRDGGTAFVAGEPKTGKSWALTELALAVSSGLKAFGEFVVPEARPVMYFYAEDFDRDVQCHLRALCVARGVAVEDVLGRLWVQPRGRFIDVTKDEDLALVIASCRRYPGGFDGGLLCLEPLRDIHSGEEDGSDEMGVVMKRLRVLGEILRCTIATVHHTAKMTGDVGKRRPGQKMRGSSVLHASADAGLYLSDADNRDEGGRNVIAATVSSEVKGARGAGVFGLELSIIDGEDGTAESAGWTFLKETAVKKREDEHASADEVALLESVERYRAAGQPFTAKDHVLKAVGGNRSRLGDAYDRLLRAGKILFVNDTYLRDGHFPTTRRILVVSPEVLASGIGAPVAPSTIPGGLAP